jgi:cbb3-type cytochrome oxidase maturation protein
MEVLVLLIPVSVILVLLIGAGFWWSVKSGQFDDLEGPAHRILADDDSTDAIPSEAPDPGDVDSKTADRALTPVKPPRGGSR